MIIVLIIRIDDKTPVKLCFIGKVNVAVAAGVAVATLLVAIIIIVLGCWLRKFKSKKGG